MRISTPVQEGVYQASKWLKIQLLVEQAELEALFAEMGDFGIYLLTGLVDLEEAVMPKSRFLQEYGCWIEGLKRGVVPSDSQLRSVLACAWSVDPDPFWLQAVPNGKYLVKMGRPVLQVQAHHFTYSEIDRVFRPMSMGLKAIFWGLQISYPQLYQDPKTMELLEVGDSANGELFTQIRRWVREATRPTPFVVDGHRTNVPIRLGKQCFSWIGNHPQLKMQGISLYGN